MSSKRSAVNPRECEHVAKRLRGSITEKEDGGNL
jgi:hypothetical protein